MVSKEGQKPTSRRSSAISAMANGLIREVELREPRPSLAIEPRALFLAEDGIRRCQKFRVVIVGQLTEETADPVERLAEEKLRGTPICGSGSTVLIHALKIGIEPAEHAGRCEHFHRRTGNAFLDQLHVHDRFAVLNQRFVYAQVESPDQTTELRSIRAQALGFYRHARDAHSGAKPIHAGRPRFAQSTRRI